MPDNFRHPIFETNRLRLRTLEPGDEEFLAALDSDPAVMQYIHTGALLPRTALRWAQSQIEMASHRRHLHKWIVEAGDHDGNKAGVKIGWIELSKFRGIFDPDESRSSDDVSIGYQFGRAYWQQGFASEAVRPVLAYAFDTLRLDRVVAFVHTGNQRSARLLERLGFRRHATRRYMDQGGHECFLYALMKEILRPK
jgi:ribosomal-protein-alanine N-acetyltransferase